MRPSTLEGQARDDGGKHGQDREWECGEKKACMMVLDTKKLGRPTGRHRVTNHVGWIKDQKRGRNRSSSALSCGEASGVHWIVAKRCNCGYYLRICDLLHRDLDLPVDKISQVNSVSVALGTLSKTGDSMTVSPS